MEFHGQIRGCAGGLTEFDLCGILMILSAFCYTQNNWIALTEQGNDDRVNSSAQTVFTRFVRVIQVFFNSKTAFKREP